MGAKISRFTDSINKRRRRSSRSGDDVISRTAQPNGSLETGHDPAVHGASLEDRNYNNESFKKRDVDPSDPQQNTAATKIQTQFRQHSAKAEVEEMREELAATRIQAGFRGYLDREQVRDMKAKLNAQLDAEMASAMESNKESKKDLKADAAEDEEHKREDENREVSDENEKDASEQQKTKSDGGDDIAAANDEEEVDIDLEDPEVEQAAIKIQAGFKGFKARKEVQEKTAQPKEEEKPKANEEDEEVDIDLGDPEVQKAALKIQTGFRGHQARKEVTQKKDSHVENVMKTNKEEEGVKEGGKEGGGGEEEEVDIDLEDPEVGKAALKIQAGFKGLKARKEIAMKKTETTPNTADDSNTSSPKPIETKEAKSNSNDSGVADELADIDLKDPDLAKVTLKLQAGFRGFKSRKKPTEVKPEPSPKPPDDIKTSPKPLETIETKSNSNDSGVADELADIDLKDPDLAKVTLKLQAGFRGFKSRKKPTEVKPEPTPKPPDDIKTSPKPLETIETKSNSNDSGVADELADIDLKDPDLAKVTLKLQAGFRGFKSRKKPTEVKTQAGSDSPVSGSSNSSTGAERSNSAEAKTDPTSSKPNDDLSDELKDIDLKDPDLGKAALKIQMGFKLLKSKKKKEESQKESLAKPQEQTKDDPKELEEKEEEVDIDLNDPEVEKAAVKIQAGFKGFKARQKVSKEQDQPEPPATQPQIEETSKQEGEEEVDIDLEDPATEQAALKIQAGFRGYKTRKDLNEPSDNQETTSGEAEPTQASAEQEQPEKAEEVAEAAPSEEVKAEEPAAAAAAEEAKPEEEVIDIDLTDPEVEKAATKIQAGFKGFKTRKEVQQQKAETTEAQPSEDQVDAVPDSVQQESTEVADEVVVAEAAPEELQTVEAPEPEVVEEKVIETETTEASPPEGEGEGEGDNNVDKGDDVEQEGIEQNEEKEVEQDEVATVSMMQVADEMEIGEEEGIEELEKNEGEEEEKKVEIEESKEEEKGEEGGDETQVNVESERD